MDKDKKSVSKLAFMLSALTLILAAVVSIFKLNNFWLAGTQWMLISIVLAVYAIYFNGCDCSCCNNDKEKKQ